MELKHKVLLGLLLILTFGVRCLHLAFDHFPIVNPDSMYFWILVKEGDVPWYQNGLAPILEHTGMAGMILIPPLIGVATAILLYYFAAKVFNPKIGLISVAFFALLHPAAMMGLAGNIDRDALTLFLITLGLFVYFFSRTWKGGLAVAAICGLLVFEWRWMGAGILLTIIAFSALVEYWQNHRLERVQPLLTLGVIVGLIAPFYISTFYADFGLVMGQQQFLVSELQPINAILLWPYWVILLIPLAFAFLKLWNKPVLTNPTQDEIDDTIKERNGMWFLASWIIASILMGLIAYRLSIFMVSAACVLGAVGFVHALQILPQEKKRAALLFTVVMLLISGTFAADLPQSMTMPNTWVDAMEWTKTSTPKNAKFMTWWDNGYWVLGMGEREAITNASHVRSVTLNHRIALVYCSCEDSYPAALMEQYGTDYVIFSAREENYFPTIEKNAGIDGADGLFFRSKNPEFESDYFQVVYRNKDVWIMRLKPQT